MKRLVIHIGAHKTGTTALQRCFDANSAQLEQAAVIYPRTNWYHHSQHRLAFALQRKKDPTTGKAVDLDTEIDALNAVVDAAPGESRIMISSEALFALRPRAIATLRDRLTTDAVEIVAFVRSPDKLLLSLYNQMAKGPENQFSKTLSAVLKAPRELHRDLDMRKCVEAWVSAFGRENVHLLCYEDGAPLAQMLRILDLPEDAIRESVQANPSAPHAVAEVMRLSKTAGIPPDIRRTLYGVASRVFGAYPKPRLTDVERRSILREFETDLDALFTQFGLNNPYRADAMVPEPPPAKRWPPVKLLSLIIENLLGKSDGGRRQ